MRAQHNPSWRRVVGAAALAVATISGAATANAQGTTLTLMFLGSYQAANEQAIAGFQKENPDITIKASYTAEPQSIRALFTTGNAPDIPMVYPGDGSAIAVKQLARAGLLEDLSGEAWAKTVSPSFIQSVTFQDKVYVLPTGYSYIAMYANDEVMKSVGATVPRNFADLLSFCDKAKATTIPMAFGLKEQLPVLFPGYALAASTAFADNARFAEDQASGKASFSSGYRASMEMYLQMRDHGCFSKDASGNSNDDALRQVAGGKAGLYVGVINYLPLIMKYNPDAKIIQAPFPGNTDAAKVRLPLGPTPGYGVSSQSKNKAAAKKFIAYLQRPEVNRAWALAAAQLAGADIDAAPQTPGNSEAIRELLVAKRTVLYLDRAWPNARIQPVYMAGVQQLFAGQTTIEALLKRLDDAYALGAQ